MEYLIKYPLLYLYYQISLFLQLFTQEMRDIVNVDIFLIDGGSKL